ncbi:succinate dehydrogenase, cytochrome b556 subunit [Crenothrix sp.]|uniref:succinate dehydrogenase, cytochrome b556 subunit n=1 Tax=Crenothrix sp. TaxID=3100433 RepID=UPI00374CD2F7
MANPRPTSPHLQIYKLPLSGLNSISHRITGVFLSVGLIGVVYILWAISGGITAYQNLQTVMNLGVVQVLYWGFIYALFFHLCHGVRHLLWDMVKGFERDTLNRYAILEIVVALLLTLFTFVITG